MLSKRFHAFWDSIWDIGKGCLPVDETCRNCFAARSAGTLQQAAGADREVRDLYAGTTKRPADGRYVFNGTLTELPFWHPKWSWPLRWPGAASPLMGAGKPSLIFVGCETDLFIEGRSKLVIDHTLDILVRSPHIGQVLSKRSARVREYFETLAVSPEALARWQASLWVGFSGGTQAGFDERWAHMRPLAEQGWLVWASLAPLLEPITLPPDFLRLARWCVISGEQGVHEACRPMDPRWAQALVRQCQEAGVAVFVKQMSKRAPIPPDLWLARQFPEVP
jgi:protein gp37